MDWSAFLMESKEEFKKLYAISGDGTWFSFDSPILVDRCKMVLDGLQNGHKIKVQIVLGPNDQLLLPYYLGCSQTEEREVEVLLLKGGQRLGMDERKKIVCSQDWSEHIVQDHLKN